MFKHVKKIYEASGQQIRVILAISLCVVLVLKSHSFREDLRDAEAELIWQVSDASREILELVSEAVQYRNQLILYEVNAVSLDQVQLQFEVLWSRVNVAQFKRIGAGSQVEASLQDFEVYLEEVDAVLFGDEALSLSQIASLKGAIETRVSLLRSQWARSFSRRSTGAWLVNQTETLDKIEQSETRLQALLVLLLSYLVVELFLSFLTQKRLIALRQKAESGERAKSFFIANVSHEIRTPLNGIMGLISVLRESKNLNAEDAKALSVVQESSDLLLATVNDILDMAQLEAGHLLFEKKPFDPGSAIQSSLALFDVMASKAQCDIKLYGLDDLPQNVVGDCRRFRQVLNNLIANALKYAPGSVVSLRAEYDRLHGLRVTISDSGSGISHDLQKQLFQPFTREADATHSSTGTGLGLSLSKKFCEGMGGKLTYMADHSRGATFRVELPFASTGALHQEGDENFSDLNILVADDNKTNLLVFEKLVGRICPKITQVVNGQEAFELSKSGAFDVVFLDVHMPVLDGPSAAQKILAWFQQEQLRPPHLVALTANISSADAVKYRAAGMCTVLAKPLEIQSVKALLAGIQRDSRPRGCKECLERASQCPILAL